MGAYNKVLVAVDLHGSPEQVLARAAEMLDSSKASVHILNVLPDPAYINTSFPAYSGSLAGFDWEALREEALAKIGVLAANSGLSHVEIVAQYGRTTDVILDQARQLSADLIIVGSHGRRGVSLLLGSTANGVLHRATCDVLAVRITQINQSTE